MAGHRQKKSTFSSTICSKYEHGAQMNKFELNKSIDSFADILLRTENVLENYKVKCDNLEKENKKYKKKYSDALKKIKGLEIKIWGEAMILLYSQWYQLITDDKYVGFICDFSLLIGCQQASGYS